MRFYHQKRNTGMYTHIYMGKDLIDRVVLDSRVERLARSAYQIFEVCVIFIKGTSNKILFANTELSSSEIELLIDRVPNASSWIGKDIVNELVKNGGPVPSYMTFGQYVYRSRGNHTYRGLALLYNSDKSIKRVVDDLVMRLRLYLS